MKLYVTIGTNNESYEHTFEVAEGEYATYIGLEMDASEIDPNEPGYSKTGRLTILRTPFNSHGLIIHTICDWPSEEIAVIEREGN